MFPNPFPFALFSYASASSGPDISNRGAYVDGYLGNWAISFDSSASPKQYIDINNYSDIHSLPSGTISMWVNPNISGESFPTLVAAGDNGVNNTYFEWYINPGDSTVRFAHYNAGTNNTNIRTTNTITANTWSHVALTSDGTTGKIYLNGVDSTTGVKNAGDWFADNSGLDNLTLGIMIYNGGTLFAPYSGSMDEVAFWNVPLSSGSISNLYNNGSGSRADSFTTPDLVNGAWVPGKLGNYGLRFVYNTSNDTGGASLNSTYVDIGGTATDFARTQAYSITGWLKPNFSGGEADRIDIFANNVGGASPQGWYVLSFQKKLYFFFGTSGTAYIIKQTNSAVLNTTDFLHFAITYDGSSANTGIKIYINGSEAASTGGSAGTFNGTVDYNSARLRIGGMANGSSIFHRFPGIMDELAVWDVELDSGAVSSLYNSGYGSIATNVSSSDLVAYYNMENNGPGSTTLIDASSNSNNGTLTNFDTTNTGSLMLYYDFEGGPGTAASIDRSGNNHTGSLTNMDAGG